MITSSRFLIFLNEGGKKNAPFVTCCLSLIGVGNKFFLVTVIEMQLIYVEQQIQWNLLKDCCVVLPELRCDLSAEIKSKFPISIKRDYSGRAARIDKPEFAGLCLELGLATKHIEHMQTAVRTLNMPPEGLLCKVSPSRKIIGSFPPWGTLFESNLKLTPLPSQSFLKWDPHITSLPMPHTFLEFFVITVLGKSLRRKS